MIKEIEKALKRYLKGKNRITMGVVVAFLLGSSFAFGNVIIKYEDSTLTLTAKYGKDDIGTITGNHAAGFTWTVLDGTELMDETVEIDDTVNANNIKVNIVNNGIILGKNDNGDNLGNGINSYSDTSDSILGDITNNRTINGNSSGGDKSGNGIYSYSNGASTIGNITNSGNINGSATGSGNHSGNGIFSYSYSGVTIGDITNSGTISGSSTGGYHSGNGIYSYSDSRNSSTIIENIKNSGIISGKNGSGEFSGNGIYFMAGSAAIENIKNSGIISGNSNGGASSGNGIYSLSDTNDRSSIIGNVKNSGIISGNNGGNNGGNGIYSAGIESVIGDIVNNGTISGNSTGNNGGNGIYSLDTLYPSVPTSSTIGNITNYGIISGSTTGSGNDSGNGIYSSSAGPAIIESVSNYGVIMGSDNGIYIKGDSSSKIKGYSNYGLVIGQTPVKIEGGEPIKKPEGNGMAITLESDGSIKTNGITSGNEGSAEGYSIINTTLQNGKKEAYNVYTSDQSISDTIINGAGVKSGTVTINAGNFSLTNGIINAYKTAVTVNAGASFTGTDVTINGGGLDRTAPVISGDSGANTVNISGNSFINGDIDLDAGDDILNFGSAVSRTVGNDNINLFHRISNVEEININQKVTAFETSEITGAKDINIGKNGEFVLRIDTSKVDNTSGTDKITGHALYGNIGTISSTGGKLLLALNGAGNESIISFGKTELDSDSFVVGSEGKYQEDVTLDTTSLLHSVEKIDLSNNEIKITAKFDLPTKPTNPDNITYEKLNKIYHGIRSLEVDGLENFNIDTNEKLSSFMGYLNDIYAGNPYSYSSELSRKSMGMFRDIVT
ncbi:beta strand repeat-containing protein, partial [Fusobacterium varium]|uniref:beta strand repeat-containing protein n=1 Tax=Fusobacterium varium TaxID=856 RepID=UPI00359C67E0